MHPGQAVADFQQRGFAPIYAPPGFVHTSYSLLWPPGTSSTFKCNTTAGIPGCGIPPELFTKHREWFWPPAPAAPTAGQLCWSNASLQQFMIAQVKGFLALNPGAEIISVSQNDNGHQCETPEEKSINAAEGTAGGALFRAINGIADAIKNDYPRVAIDTLACESARCQWCSSSVSLHRYWCDTSCRIVLISNGQRCADLWSRPAPKITKLRPNVVVRLSTIGSNFAEPLDSLSNAAFQQDLHNWVNASQRIYVWNVRLEFVG